MESTLVNKILFSNQYTPRRLWINALLYKAFLHFTKLVKGAILLSRIVNYMVKDVKKLLVSLGLSSSEIEVFLAIFQVGPDVVSKIARKAHVNRASSYDIIRRLLLKGLI